VMAMEPTIMIFPKAAIYDMFPPDIIHDAR
jgi:hypothetical protein